jgi:anhydro-N-acetylmuramic acid kinase
MADLYIGLMSGTSMDGVDGVLVRLDDTAPRLQVLAHADAPFDTALRAELFALNTAGPNELHRAALAGNALVRLYAQVVAQLLRLTGVAAHQVQAIGAHGQTVRHQPQSFDGCGYTLQLNQPALLAELSGITVVADFRSRDVAAGGQGAPLVPRFHQAIFSQTGQPTALLNLGGIANLTVLAAGAAGSVQGLAGVSGFDCGPANALLDAWCLRSRGQAFDANGDWAASGSVIPALLERCLAEPYFELGPPKSTGRDLFNDHWLAQVLLGWQDCPAQDIQATLAELTARTCADAVLRHAAGCRELVVCGGGARNIHLLARLQAMLVHLTVTTSTQHGLDPQHVEACAFAWLARQAMLEMPGNLSQVTGARGERILGATYPR